MNTAKPPREPRMTRTEPFATGRWVRTLAIMLAALATAAVSFAVSYAAVMQRRAPAQALRLWPSSEAKAAVATRLLTQPDRSGSYARARRLAAEALQAQPMSVRAASTLAFLAANTGNVRQAKRLLAYSERLSRRDLPTQIALIEAQVQANDVPGALVHYDRALRTSKASEAILVPVLVGAVASLDVARPLAPLLAPRADWWKPFTLQMIQQGTPAPSSYTLLHALRLDMRRPDEHAMAQDAITRMAGQGRVDLAARLYTELQPRRPAPSANVHDGLFRSTGGLAPFDWDLTSTGDLSASVEARPDGKGNGLFLIATNGASGTAARQLLVPSPGHYALRFDIGLLRTGSRVTAALRCNGSDTLLAFARPTPNNATQHIVLPFAVASSCRGVWIEFGTQASEGMDTSAPWVSAVRVSAWSHAPSSALLRRGKRGEAAMTVAAIG
jgi:hypothetical protein